MATRVALEHWTSYRYDRAVWVAPHVVRLRPTPTARTTVSAYDLQVTPGAHRVHWQHDVFGNHVARYVFEEHTEELRIDVRAELELTPVNPFDFLLDEAASTWPVAYEPPVARALLPSLAATPPTPREHAFLAEARAVAIDGRPTTDVLVDLNRLVHDRVAYEVREEPGVQTPDETLERGAGSCRDQVWLLVHVLRTLGVACRFTSGWLVEVGDDPAEDAMELHAWADCHLPGAGWVGLDPTNAVLATEGHVPLAAATEPELAAPVSGTTDRAVVEFTHGSRVRRLDGGDGS